eukprot:scaffold31862_cov63-Phaeocystis_antarctica.AAC.11
MFARVDTRLSSCWRKGWSCMVIKRKNRSTSSATKSRREEWPAWSNPVEAGDLSQAPERRRDLSGTQMGSSCGPRRAALSKRQGLVERIWVAAWAVASQVTLTLLQRSRGCVSRAR